MSDAYVPMPPPEPPQRSSALTVLVLLMLIAVLMVAIGGGAIWYFLRKARLGEVEEGTFLHVVVDGDLTDGPRQPGLFDDPSSRPASLGEVGTALRKAAGDPRVTGLYLELEGVAGGWATANELRTAVEAFVASGKPCVAYAPTAFTNGTYTVASACPTVGTSPGGVMMVTGLAFEVSYYRGLFDWLGIEPEFEHVGDFKSAIEAYELTGPSVPAAEAYEGLVGSLYGQMVASIAKGRKIAEGDVQGLINQPTLTPRIALTRGMVDVLAWPDAMRAHVHEVGSEGWQAKLDAPLDPEAEPKLTPVKEYVKELRSNTTWGQDQVAVLYAEGNIASGDGGGGIFGDDGLLTDSEYAEWMEEVRKNDEIKAVVVRVISPGGSALASSLMWRENEAVKATGRPLVISMGDYAASGGYLISANADWIVADPGTLTGSIGVFGGKFDLSGGYTKLGITTHTFQRGEMANLLSFSQGFNDAERVVFKEYLADFYDQFLTVVSEGRKLDRDAVHAVAQGRVWTGEQALQHKLVDQLGTLQDAITKAAELAKITEYDVRVVPKPRSFFEELSRQMEDGKFGSVSAAGAMLPGLDPRWKTELATLEAISRDGGAAAYLPGSPTAR